MKYALLLPLFLFSACTPQMDEQEPAVVEPIAAESVTPASSSGDFADAPMAVAIVTADIEASIEFYQNVLGFKPTGGFEIDAEFGKALGLVDGAAFIVTTFTTGDHPSAVTFKLVAFTDPLTHREPAKVINEATGVQYLTLMVNDMDPILQRLQKTGIQILSKEGMTVGKEKNQDFVLVKDPDGTFIELIETPR